MSSFLSLDATLFLIMGRIAEREPGYTRIADLIIDTTAKSPEEIIELILKK